MSCNLNGHEFWWWFVLFRDLVCLQKSVCPLVGRAYPPAKGPLAEPFSVIKDGLRVGTCVHLYEEILDNFLHIYSL